MKRWNIILCGMILVTGHAVYGQALLKGKGTFQLEIDVARFYGDSVQTFLELYYGVRENMLAYRQDSGKYRGSAHIKWTIRTDSSVVAEKEWLVPSTMDDSSRMTMQQTLIGIESVGLPPGTYAMTLTAYDVNDRERKDSVTVPLSINQFPTDREAFSDVEFCTSIQSSSNKKSIFYKNTLEVIPNAGKLYGTGMPIMYYYLEAYNLAMGNPERPNVVIRTTIVDANGKEVLNKEKTKPRLHNSSVEIGTVNLSGLFGGTYLFKASMIDTGQHVLAVATKKFFVYRPGMAVDTSNNLFTSSVAASEFALMTEEDADRSFGYARYIASQPERDQYPKLVGVNAKQNFLFEFWRRRDTDPATPVNEFKESYERRAEEANRTFANGGIEGWKTDRGRVYMVYGPSDEIERFPNTAENLPYEKWNYHNLQGGVEFVFVDRRGHGDYELIHSTHRNELRDDGWLERWVRKAE